MDVGFHGPCFTWTNGQKGKANIRERLDRVWCNVHMWQSNADLSIKHLLRVASDHHPILLGKPRLATTGMYKGFHFLDVWFHPPEFGSKVEEFWKGGPYNLHDNIEAFKEQIWHWNNEVFGNIFWRKNKCKARLLSIQRALMVRHRNSLCKLERKLERELREILIQEEMYWRQQARVQ